MKFAKSQGSLVLDALCTVVSEGILTGNGEDKKVVLTFCPEHIDIYYCTDDWFGRFHIFCGKVPPGVAGQAITLSAAHLAPILALAAEIAELKVDLSKR